MKKVFSLLMALTTVFVLSACLPGRGGAEVVINIPDEFPEEDVEILMWHAFGDDNMALLDEIFDDFKEIYPNVSIRHLGQGGYDGLRQSTIQGTVAGSTPTMVFGYPDHFVEYLNGNSLIPLDEYIAHPEFGVELDDYIEGFLLENQQYLDGLQYSMPFAKSTEMVVYNKTVFDHYGIEFSLDEAISFDDLEQIVADHDILGSGEWQAPHLFNADSESNFFINSSQQWNAGYTTAEGEILFDNPTTRDMLDYYRDLMDRNILTLPIEWDENYGSIPFKDGRVLMSQGSTAGTRHNVPDQPAGRFGIFEMSIMPVVQYDLENRSAIQQGPNIAIMADTTDAERLAAWELLKFMTNPENTAFFAMNTGYVPVRESAFDDEAYQEFLAIADYTRQELLDEGRFDDADRLPFAQAARVAQAQVPYYTFEPPFVGRVTSSNVRSEVGLMMEAIYAETRTVEQALQRALRELGQ